MVKLTAQNPHTTKKPTFKLSHSELMPVTNWEEFSQGSNVNNSIERENKYGLYLTAHINEKLPLTSDRLSGLYYSKVNRIRHTELALLVQHRKDTSVGALVRRGEIPDRQFKNEQDAGVQFKLNWLGVRGVLGLVVKTPLEIYKIPPFSQTINPQKYLVLRRCCSSDK
jgi:hypothetical protein